MRLQWIRRRLAVTLAFVLMLTLCAPALAGQMTVYVAVDDAIMYDANGNNIGTLPLNTPVTLTAVKSGVCRVTCNGTTAYMSKAELSQSPVNATPYSEQTITAYVAKDGAKLYNAKGKALETLALNAAVSVSAVQKGICKVTANGREGYMYKSDLTTSPASAAPQSAEGIPAYVKTQGAKVYDASGAVIATLGVNVVVTVTAAKGKKCQVTTAGKSGYMYKSDLSREKVQTSSGTVADGTGASTVAPATGSAREMDWWTSDIQKIFARGVVAQITDVETGLSWRERRNGGTNHADCQPVTAADTAAMKKAYGGKWSWDRRAVFVTINGVNYAASINGMPHGDGSIKDNNFDGHHCIHFTNSRTHSTNKVCPLHQAAIRQAAITSL